MARRFTYENKYYDKRFVNLSNNTKLLYYYLYETADVAGFNELLSGKIEQCVKLSEQETQEAISELEQQEFIILSENRKKIWFKDYLEEQGNYPINLKNSAHKGIIKSLKRHIYEFSENIELFIKLSVIHKDNMTTIKEIMYDDIKPYLNSQSPLD